MNTKSALVLLLCELILLGACAPVPHAISPQQKDIALIALSDMNVARYGSASATDGNYIYAICGGTFRNSGRVTNIERYDPTNDTWTEFVSGLMPRRYCSAEYVSSQNKIYILNGSSTNIIEIIDIPSSGITDTPTNPYPVVYGGSATWNDKIFIFGGSNPDGYSSRFYEFDVSTETWTRLPDMPEAKETSGEIVDSILYVLGGYNGSVSTRIDAYDIQDATWRHIGEMPIGISAHATAVSGKEIWLAGSYTNLQSLAVFNTETNEFTQLSSNMTGRRHAAAEFIGNRLYIFGGGVTPRGPALGSLEYADVSNYTISTVTAISPKSQLTISQPPQLIGGYAAIYNNFVYPEEARESGIEGKLVIKAFVDSTGSVTETVVVQGFPNTGLDEAAIEAIRKTSWRPAKQGSYSLGVWVEIPLVIPYDELPPLNTEIDQAPQLVINSVSFFINRIEISESPSKSILESALGKPDRTEKKPGGIRYIYDNYGISFRTDVDNDAVSDIMLYLTHSPYVPPEFGPQSHFAGSLIINGKKFPKTDLIQDVIEQIPEIKPDPKSYGNIYDAVLGKRTLSVFTPPPHGKIVWVTINLSYESRKAKLGSLLKKSKVLEKSLSMYSSLHGYRDSTIAEQHVVRPGLDARLSTSIVFAFQRPNLIHIKAKNPSLGPTEVISDGMMIVNHIGRQKQYRQRKAPEILTFGDLKDPTLVGLSALMSVHKILLSEDAVGELLGGVEEVEEVGHENLEGHPTTIVELTTELDSTYRVRLWIGEDDFLIRKAMFRMRTTGLAESMPEEMRSMMQDMTMHLEEKHLGIAINPSFSEEIFTFKPPEDTELVERSGQLGRRRPPSRPIDTSELVGQGAPNFILEDLNGNEVRLTDFKGKVLIVDFWATWCGPCRQEIPIFVTLQSQYASRGFSMIGISTDEDPEVVRSFAKEYKMNYPSLMADARIRRAYGVNTAIPTTFVIDGKGTIRYRYVGVPPDQLIFQKNVEELLGE